MKVFVYGTLKRDQRNHHHLGDAKFIGTGFARGVAMIDGPGFPFAFIAKRKAIVGEVYEVTKASLTHLDRFEGVPILYTREKRFIRLPEGTARAFIYLATPQTLNGRDLRKTIVEWKGR